MFWGIRQTLRRSPHPGKAREKMIDMTPGRFCYPDFDFVAEHGRLHGRLALQPGARGIVAGPRRPRSMNGRGAGEP